MSTDSLFIDLYEERVEKEEKYTAHMLQEKHKKEGGDIDPDTGWRVEYWDIGMTRNAKSENKKKTKVFLDPIPHIVLDQNVPLRGWYKSKFEPEGTRPRPCYTDALLTQPYGGFCSVGCGFCYINNGTRGYRGQGVTVVDPAYPEKIRDQLRKMRTGAAVYMSSFIDPFLEVEDHYGNSERTARYADAVGLPLFFLTRKNPPEWAFELLKKNAHSYMQFSINTSNPADWKKLSPRAVSLPQMYENVNRMHKEGIYVSIQVNPIIAGITTNDDIVKLIHELAEQGADHLIFKFVEIVYPSAPSMISVMRRRFGDRADAFEQLFCENIGGVKTVAEHYRKDALDRFKVETKKAGVTMSVCYEYEYERDGFGAIISKAGVSMGPQYLTGDQCHGHQVPMYSRASAEDLFVPIEGCAKGGCLHCADEAGGEDQVACGNETLAKAPALLAKDLTIPAWTTKHGAGSADLIMPKRKTK